MVVLCIFDSLKEQVHKESLVCESDYSTRADFFLIH